MATEDAMCAACGEHVAAGTNRHLEAGHVVAERNDESTRLKKIALHVDDEARPRWLFSSCRVLQMYVICPRSLSGRIKSATSPWVALRFPRPVMLRCCHVHHGSSGNLHRHQGRSRAAALRPCTA